MTCTNHRNTVDSGIKNSFSFASFTFRDKSPAEKVNTIEKVKLKHIYNVSPIKINIRTLWKNFCKYTVKLLNNVKAN